MASTNTIAHDSNAAQVVVSVPANILRCRSKLLVWSRCVPWAMIMQKGCSKHEGSSGSAGAIHGS